MNDERVILASAAAALQVPLTDFACERLLGFLELLRKWNRVYNLSAVRETPQMLTHHLCDSLAVVAPLRRELLRQPPGASGARARLLDVGSGAGLPGVVLAVCCPELEIDCIDAVAKKTAFVQQVALELSLPNLHSLHGRVEALRCNGESGAYDIVSARAFASLEKLVDASSHLLAGHGSWLAMKGRIPRQEMAALPAIVEVFHVEPVNVPGLFEQRCIVWLRKKIPAPIQRP